MALLSDALWARTGSEETRDMLGAITDVTRMRVGLEGNWRLALAGGGQLTPSLEAGVRHDGGDAETGFGVEIGGGLAWADPRSGLSLDIEARTLLAHEADGRRDRGLSATVGFDPNTVPGRGLSVMLRQDFGGSASGGLDALFGPEPVGRHAGGDAGNRWTLEAAYGLPVFGGRFTGSPLIGYGQSGRMRDYSLGWRLTPARPEGPDLSFGIEITRRESAGAPPDHGVGVDLSARW